jgi:chromosome partitioning protein
MTPHSSNRPPDAQPPRRSTRTRQQAQRHATAMPRSCRHATQVPPVEGRSIHLRRGVRAAARVTGCAGARRSRCAPPRLRACAVAHPRSKASAHVRICAARTDRRPVMSAVVVAVLSRKGGAGKTSLTKDLGFALSELGVRVLQVGLDPQSSLEVLAGLGSDTPPERTVSRLLMPEEFRTAEPPEAVVVHPSLWGTELIPASKALAAAERALGDPGRGGANQRLKRGLERLDIDRRCELVLIDCPPGMTPLTMNALVAADAVLVPTQLDFLSVAGLALLMETVDEVREYDNPRLRCLGIVGTQADERTRHARDVRAQLEQLFGPNGGGTLCRTVIRHSTRVRDAHAAHLAVGQFDPTHPVSQDHRDLAHEIAVRARFTTSALGAAR